MVSRQTVRVFNLRRDYEKTRKAAAERRLGASENAAAICAIWVSVGPRWVGRMPMPACPRPR
jgi:hypothetical protein